MATQSSPYYYFAPDAMQITLNSLFSDPQYASVGVASSARILVANEIPDKDGNMVEIGYGADLQYKQWALSARNAHFADDTIGKDIYMYVMLPKDGARATLGYTTDILDILGQSTITSNEDSVVNQDYYYIHIATFHYDSTTNRRTLSYYDSGKLKTQKMENEESTGDWNRVFVWNKIKGWLQMIAPFHNIMFRGKDEEQMVNITAIHTSEDEYEGSIDNSSLGTTGFFARWFLSRAKDERTEHTLRAGKLITDSSVQTDNWNDDESILGTGAAMYKDAKDGAHVVTDYLVVRKKASFTEIEVHELRAVGGEIVLSPAAMKCSRVERVANGYKCYFNNTETIEEVNADGQRVETTRTIFNEFRINDQARCQTFNFTEKGAFKTKYYWRLVTDLGADYIVLSDSDCDTGSDVPTPNDNIVCLGNRTDTDRQSAQILSAVGEDAPSIKLYTGINFYALSDDKQTHRISPKGNKFTGEVHITEGSNGAENLDIRYCNDNLLYNSGFYGNLESTDLSTDLAPDTEVFSPSLLGWNAEGVEVRESADSASGYALHFTANGNISQEIPRLIVGENYFFSAKGTGTVTLTLGGITKTLDLTGEFASVSFKPLSAGTLITISAPSGTMIYEPLLERGTVVSNRWTRSIRDAVPGMEKFQALTYLTQAIQDGATSILGGLILSNLIELGNYANGEMQQVTAGLSGIYTNPDDIALWGGGTLDKAISAVRKFAVEHPEEVLKDMTDDDWKELANVVITHGGRAILNDAIFRGNVYAKDGVFNGTVYANDGVFHGKIEANEGYMQNVSLTGSLIFNASATYMMRPYADTGTTSVIYEGIDIHGGKHRILDYGMQSISQQGKGFNPFLIVGDIDDAYLGESETNISNDSLNIRDKAQNTAALTTTSFYLNTENNQEYVQLGIRTNEMKGTKTPFVELKNAVASIYIGFEDDNGYPIISCINPKGEKKKVHWDNA